MKSPENNVKKIISIIISMLFITSFVSASNLTTIAATQNLALNKTATAKSSLGLDYGPEKAVDGNYMNFWCPPGTNSVGPNDIPSWIDIDFGVSTTFNRVIVSEYIFSGEGNRLKEMIVQTWDGSQWVDQKQMNASTDGKTKFNLVNTVTSNKVRLFVKSVMDTKAPAVSEIEVYNINAASNYTVTFNSNGGSACSPITDIAVGSTITLPLPTNRQYVFEGWFTDEKLTMPFTSISIVKGNITLYAKWNYITYSEGTIIQRDNNNQAIVPIKNYIPLNADTQNVKIRAVLFSDAKRGKTTDWYQLTKTDSKFSGQLSVKGGGWYYIELCEMDVGSNVISTSKIIKKIGIGEVFITAGQSNSACFGGTKTTTKYDTVVTYNPANNTWVKCADIQPSISSFNTMASVDGGSPWPTLGDNLTEKLGVPIGFVLTGYGGASISQYQPTANSLYNYIKKAINILEPTGFRAILWHQGESDTANGTSTDAYKTALLSIINQSRIDAGFDVPWMIANASYYPTYQAPPNDFKLSHAVRLGQASACNETDIFLGPDTDQWGSAYRNSDNVHFNLQGLITHGNAWAGKLYEKIFKIMQITISDNIISETSSNIYSEDTSRKDVSSIVDISSSISITSENNTFISSAVTSESNSSSAVTTESKSGTKTQITEVIGYTVLFIIISVAGGVIIAGIVAWILIKKRKKQTQHNKEE